MRRSLLLGIDLSMVLVVVAMALAAHAGPNVAMIEVKGMVCSA